MSKSIKDYKKGMDSVSISDSFYERTERMLKESGSERITVSSRRSGIKYIAFGSMAAAAACAVLVFMHEPAVPENEITETSAVTSVCEVTPANETIYIDLEEDDVIYTISPAAIPDADVSEEPAADENMKEYAAEEYAAEEYAAEDAVPAHSTTIEVVAPLVTQTDMDELVTEEVVEEAAAEIDMVQKLYAVKTEEKETELTSYLSAGLSAENHGFYEDDGAYEPAAPSGINFLILDSGSAAEIIEMTAEAVSAAHDAPVKNIRSPEFVIEINDFATGRNEFIISVNDDGTIGVTCFEGEESFSEIYAVHREEFNRIEKVLFLKFGSISQYEDFMTE